MDARPQLPAALELPVLPLRGPSLFPSSMMTLTVGRPSTRRAVESVGESKLVAVVAQRDPDKDDPNATDLFSVGVAATVIRAGKVPSEPDTMIVLVEGLRRIRFVREVHRHPYLRVVAQTMSDIVPDTRDSEYAALERNVQELFAEVVQGSSTVPGDVAYVTRNIKDPSILCDLVASSLPFLARDVRQELLETLDVRRRMRRLTEVLIREREEQQIRNKIQSDIADKITAHPAQALPA